ncbi:hypothetical protein GGR57DRAFT_365062 [Xylariaceae sp. FL1272]|nr:hypothetical protein GGR57DRAFT_365062 [Xylariaceae sp. FL1272]
MPSCQRIEMATCKPAASAVTAKSTWSTFRPSSVACSACSLMWLASTRRLPRRTSPVPFYARFLTVNQWLGVLRVHCVEHQGNDVSTPWHLQVVGSTDLKRQAWTGQSSCLHHVASDESTRGHASIQLHLPLFNNVPTTMLHVSCSISRPYGDN